MKTSESWAYANATSIILQGLLESLGVACSEQAAGEFERGTSRNPTSTRVLVRRALSS
jgi:hypothetical protein